MLLQLALTNLPEFLIVAGALILALAVHEFAHAWAADTLGDPTPRLQGRLTLNPLAHLDPLGTILLFVAGFGWGKPVMFDPYNLKSPRRDTMLIAAAGPISNIIMAFLAALALGFLPRTWAEAAYIFFSLNISLAAFNLLPIAPLDGSKILTGLLPKHLAYEFEETMNRYGFMILIFFVLPIAGGRSPMSYVLTPLISSLQTAILLPAQIFWSFVR